MANFCGKCGSATDRATGLCPICDRDRLNAIRNSTPATTDTPISSASAEKVESKPKKGKTKATTILITILLSICLFITSFFAIIILEVRSTFDEDKIEGLLDNVQATRLLDNVGTTSNNALIRFYNILKRNHGIEMTDFHLNNFIEKSTIKKFFAEKLADFFENFYEDEGELKITYREISSLLKRNSKIINEEFDILLYDNELEIIADWIFEDTEIIITDSKTLKSESPLIYYGLHIGFSYITMTVFFLLSILIIFFMIKNNASQSGCSISIVFIVLGAPLTLIATLAACFPTLWNNVCSNSLVGILAGNFAAVNALISFAVLALGILVLVIHRLQKRRSKNKGG